MNDAERMLRFYGRLCGEWLNTAMRHNLVACNARLLQYVRHVFAHYEEGVVAGYASTQAAFDAAVTNCSCTMHEYKHVAGNLDE